MKDALTILKNEHGHGVPGGFLFSLFMIPVIAVIQIKDGVTKVARKVKKALKKKKDK